MNVTRIIRSCVIYSAMLVIVLPGCGRTKQRLKAKELALTKSRPDLHADLDYSILKKNPTTMSLAELHRAKTLARIEENKELAITYLEQIVAKTADQEELKTARLELADAVFDAGNNMEKAFGLFTQFVLLYPGSKQREYAEYKAILCRFYVMLSADHDQRKTKDALELAQAYLTKSSIYHDYKQEVESIKHKCLQRLFDAEKYVFDHHMRSGNIAGAKGRIAYIRNNFEDIFQEVEPQVIGLEYSVAQAEGNAELVDKKELELRKKYPEFAQTYLASLKRKKLSDYVMRF